MSGTSGSKLDQAVKGAAPIGTSAQGLVSSQGLRPASSAKQGAPSLETQLEDPLATLPSAPPQIYLNLLILEASLRSQYLTLRDRRRQNTFFIFLLGLWITYFFYALFLAPREDGSGIGGSVYWVIETAEKVALMAGVVTGILIWGTGQWERGVRWPRRFVGISNRGLRTMNCKVVVLKGPWWREMVSHLAFLFPWRELLGSRGASDFRYVQQPGFAPSEKMRTHGYVQHATRHSINFGDGLDYVKGEDLSPGGDFIKVLLLPKPFSPDFREGWDNYRTEYWDKENDRRAQLRQRLRALDRQRAREEGGWLWWTGWRGWKNRKPADVEKPHMRNISERDARRLVSGKRGESHSRNASRSSVPGDERPGSRHGKTGSVAGPDGKRRSARNSMSMSTGPAGSAGKRSALAAPPLTRGDSSFSAPSSGDGEA